MMRSIPEDIEIARATKIKPISDIAEKIGISKDTLYQFGPYKAKIPLSFIKLDNGIWIFLLTIICVFTVFIIKKIPQQS